MKRSLSILMILVPTAALAHPGHGTGFLAGLGHPLTGIDHLLAMLAIGLWAANLGGRSVWVLPLAFVTALTLGGVIGHAVGVELPGVEQGILGSLMVLGVATALAWRAPFGAALAAVTLFGAVHGLAHGAESPADFPVFAAGFVLASCALHAAGLILGRSVRMARTMGALTALAGVALAAGVVTA
jgi:urease accessory protein